MACSSGELHAICFLWAHVFYVLILLSPLPSIFVWIRIEWHCHFNPLNTLRKKCERLFSLVQFYEPPSKSFVNLLLNPYSSTMLSNVVTNGRYLISPLR